ncbi:MAG: ABC transporter substrate-binding protein [Spirochaetota bacterium]
MTRGISRPAVLAALLLLAGGLVFGTGTLEEPSSQSTPSDARYPITVTDSLGNEMTIADKPQSIISLSLFSDEVLFELVDVDRLAGASSLAADPVYSNVAERAASVEPRVDFNVEQIIGIDPDIVFAANWSEADKVGQLRDAGVVVYQVNTPFTVEGIRDEILAVADVVGEPEAGEALVDTMQERIDALADAVGDIPEAERAEAIDYNNWGTANGVDTTWNEVLSLAAVDNAAAPFQSGDFGQVPMSKELLVELDPDVIFLPGYIWGDDDGAQEFRAQVMDDPALSGLQAIETDRVYMVPENLKGTYSHYLVDTVEFVARRVYPDRF